MTHRFTIKAENALRGALEIASQLGHTYLGSEHLLFGLAAEREGVAARILEGGGANSDKIRETVSLFTGIGRKSTVTPKDMTPRVAKIIETAGELARGGIVGTEHLLLALLHSDGCVAKKVLSTLGVDIPAMLDDLHTLVEVEKPEKSKKRNEKSQRESFPFSTFGRDLTAAAAAGRIDPVIGRDREISRVIRILSRRTKNNPCLVGDPGVGKTAIAEGLALRIAGSEVPEPLREKKIYSLDISSLIAGAKYRGEFEERMRSLLDSLRHDPSVILFIDEIHTIVGAGAAEGAIDAANILKPAMARGEIQVIGATTIEEYRRHIEKDTALERRFQSVAVEAPSVEESRAILEGLRERYEKHHGLLISDEAIDAAIRLSVRYLPEHHLPDKALDLLDEAAAELRLRQSHREIDRKILYDNLRQKEFEKEQAILAQDYERASLLRDEIALLRQKNDTAHSEIADADHPPVLGAALIAEAVSDRTGIPVGRLEEGEAERLKHLEGELSRRVIGQESAISAITGAIRCARTGVRDARRPIGSFLFLGPTGVGKTELCRALAETYFESERALLRFDMSEYTEKHAVARLIGSPPGYVGFEEGGQLTERIRRRPYSVVLFDEIEKAHPDLYHLLLQILEDGILTDSHGRTVEFRHSIIILTSNLGADGTGRSHPFGFANIDQSEDTREEESRRNELRSAFRPELLNRLDEIVVFKRLKKAELTEIAKKLIGETLDRIREAGFSLSVDESVVSYLTEIGFSEEYGARELRRAVSRHLEDRFSLSVVEGKIAGGEAYRAVADDGEIRFFPCEMHEPLPTANES